MNNNYNLIKKTLINSLIKKYPSYSFNDSTSINIFSDQVVYLQSYLKELTDREISELFLDSQVQPDNIKSLLSLFTYKRRWVNVQSGFLDISIDTKLLQFILYFLKTSTPLTILLKKDSQFQQNNISYYSINDYNIELNYDELLNIIESNQKYTINNVYQIQYNYMDENVQNTFNINNEDYNEFNLYLPYGYLIPESVKQILLDNDNNVEEFHLQTTYDELYSIMESNENGGLLEYDEKNNQWKVIVQSFFNYEVPVNHAIKITYNYSYGENGNVNENTINQFQNSQDSLLFIFQDKNGNTVTESLDSLMKKQDSYNYELSNVISVSNPLPFANGKNMESIEEYLYHQIKYNKTNARQITKTDFIDIIDLFLSNLIPQYNYYYGLESKFNWYSNTVYIYLIIEDLHKQMISEDNVIYQTVSLQIKKYLEEISPLGMNIIVKQGIVRTMTLYGEIDFDQRNYDVFTIKSYLQEQIFNYLKNVKYIGGTVNTIDIQNYLLKKDGIYYVNLGVGTYDYQGNLIQKGQNIDLLPNELISFEDISLISKNIVFRGSQ